MGDRSGRAPNPIRRRLSEEELSWVLERATTLSSGPRRSTFSESEAVMLGQELGVHPRAIRRALHDLDLRPGRRQPGRAAAEGVVPAEPAVTAERLGEALGVRMMVPCGIHRLGCWSQHRDWWPDLQRLGSELHVTVTLRPASLGSTHVRLVADLRAKAGGYVVAGGAGSVVVWLVVGPAGLLLVPLAWMALAGAAFAAYRRRADMIRRNLAELITQLG